MALDVGEGANPEWTIRALERLRADAPEAAERLEHDAGMWRRFAVVTGASEGLGDLIAARPALLDVVADEPSHHDAAAVSEEALAAVGDRAALESSRHDPAVGATLSTTHRAGILRVAVRDMLGLVDTDDAAAELADLADGLIAAAHAIVTAGGEAELVVLGMGKLGGQELNYVSDVDVIFVHRGSTSAAERMAKRLMALLGGHNPRGPAYEMDANLRPEGRNGPLTRTLDSYRAYYDRWAKTWEFQALLKARPVAGPADLAAGFGELVEPHLWPESLGGDAVVEIQEMKRRVERSRPVAKAGQRQLKLAPGGLRDIEFSAQLLQLVHGAADPSLRVRGTIAALRALAEGGYVDDGDAALFSDAYLFLRTIEHRLQLRQLRRTHTIPDDEEDLHRLARAMGFRDLPARSAHTAFNAELTRVRGGVRRIHEQLFYRPLLSTIASYGSDERVVSRGRFDTEAAQRRLRALAFAAPGQALAHLEAMVHGTDRTAKQLRVVLPTMLETLGDQPDPDGGLAALRDLTDQLRDNPRFVRFIRDSPPAARLLAQVLGASPRLGGWLSRQPEVLQLLEEPDALPRPRSGEDLVDGAKGLVRRGGGAAGQDALRRFKRREALRTALRDVTGHADVVEVGHELTSLGEGLLHAAMASLVPDEVRIAVVGLGRFGARELAHSSDLDVIFVHDGPTPVAEHALEEVLEYLSAVTPEGKAFKLDPDLRPEGRRGPLTRTLESYTAYYQRWAEPWELQALTQARPVAGDRALGETFMELVAPVVYPDPLPTDRLVAIRRMKARVERERAGKGGIKTATRRTLGRRAGSAPTRTSRNDLKLGPGGLSDVEWTVQLLTIAGGGADPSLRGPGTLDGLARLEAADGLSQEEVVWLRTGWILLSKIRNALYLAKVRDTSTMPQRPDDVAKLAARLHFAGPQEFTEEVDRARRRIRKVFDRRFFD